MDILPKKFKTNLLRQKERVTDVANVKDTTIKIFRKDKKMMTIDDIHEYYNEILKNDKKNKFEILIRGRNEYKMTTIKGFSEREIKDFDEDYWGEAIYDEDIFEENFYYLELTLRENFYNIDNHIKQKKKKK